MRELNDTANKILDVAERYTQLRGFNAFSYNDLQTAVGIKTSSIHYYFPSKNDLALIMTERYIASFHRVLRDISESHQSGVDRLESLSRIYIDGVKQDKFCLCGMLSSDSLSLPASVNEKLCEFFVVLQKWISECLELGKEQSVVRKSLNSENAASHFLASLEGGMLIARTQKQPEYLGVIVSEALAQFAQ